MNEWGNSALGRAMAELKAIDEKERLERWKAEQEGRYQAIDEQLRSLLKDHPASMIFDRLVVVSREQP